ncbi:MAG: hypothetical protein FJ315_05315 [SAR202 cluster bacterium]|nr:hypothetical protein [SAR202 cluster bacterium]
MSRIPCGECDKVFRTETGQQWHLEHRHGRTVPQVPPLELPPEAATGEPWGERCGVLGCSLFVPAYGVRVTLNGRHATGRAFPRDREGRPSSTCSLAFSESWTLPK